MLPSRPKVPALVAQELREEVGFGCPVANCRSPFLEFHHFDPTWREEQHFRPEGMVALCTKHHPMADIGVWSKRELRSLKSGPHNLETVLAKFEWARPNHLVRLGGNYCFEQFRLGLPGGSFLRSDPSELGMSELSFSLRDDRGSLVAEMDRYLLRAFPLQTGSLVVNPAATKLQLKCRKLDVLIDVWTSRKTPTELLGTLASDLIDLKPEHFGRAARADPIGHWEAFPAPVSMLLRFLGEKRIVDDDGRLSLLDFRNVRLHSGDRSILVKNGISESKQGERLKGSVIGGTFADFSF